MRNEEKDSAEKKEVGLYNFLDILVCSIAEYLCDLCKTQTTKILSYTTHQNVQYEILIDCFLTCFVLFVTVVSFCCFGLSTFRVINGFWGNHIINTKRFTLNYRESTPNETWFSKIVWNVRNVLHLWRRYEFIVHNHF